MQVQHSGFAPLDFRHVSTQHQLYRTARANKCPFSSAGHHGGQHKHEAPNVLVNTADIYPEIMHLDELNVAKQCFTKGPQRLMSPYMRTFSAQFVKGMGFKLDCKLKSDGRSGTAWFKASQWNEVCRGSDKVPGGLPGWMSSLLFYIAEDYLEKQSSIKPVANSRGATLLLSLPASARLIWCSLSSRACILSGQVHRQSRCCARATLRRQGEGDPQRGPHVRQVHSVAQHKLSRDRRRGREGKSCAGKRARRCV